MQRRADAPDHPAHELAVGRARIHESAGRKRSDDARHANFARERVDAHLDELGAHGIHHLVAMRPAGHGALAGIETL